MSNNQSDFVIANAARAKDRGDTTIVVKNNETNDKLYRKLAFLMYTEISISYVYGNV